MKKNNDFANRFSSGISCIVIGLGLMALNFLILEDGQFHMRHNTLSKEDDSFLFNIKLIASIIAAICFILIGIKQLVTNDNED